MNAASDLTTGQVAKVCGVAPRTVSKWVDTGILKGYRLPGSKDRRVAREDLEALAAAHGMPLHFERLEVQTSTLEDSNAIERHREDLSRSESGVLPVDRGRLAGAVG